MNVVRSGYIGSPSLQVSTVNVQVVPEGFNFYKFVFMNYANCTVKINSSAPIFLPSGQGFEISQRDTIIVSFIIVESGIEFNWLGGFENVIFSE